ncbi:MAG TPA: HD domain-containing phosphohydrolase [Polyangia bacterium]|jgi:HD-GYP domain-containing protein (c-di-GMP phosphodiesterase class II)
MRLAEAIGALALAADLSNGLAVEKSLRTVIVAARLARLIAGDRDAATVYWVSVLRAVGCLGFAPEQAGFSAGDDNSMRKSMAFADFSRPLDILKRASQGFAPESRLVDRARGLSQFLNPDLARRHARSHCESAMFFARSVGMPEEIAAALDTAGERFDGKGVRKIGGDDLPWAARIADVADVLELFAWTGGLDVARSILLERRGRALDPVLVDAALAEMPSLVSALRDSVWEEYLAAEPKPWRDSADDADRGLVALGRFGDLKSLFTLNHSRRVTAIAEAAGRATGLGEEDCLLLRSAGAVHDLGRVAIATGTWDKKGTLNAVEWQRVRSHSHHTETILRGAGLGKLADIAGATHERGRGVGYHRGVPLETVPLLGRIVAAADVMAALGEERPHRGPLGDAHAAKQLRSMVEEGVLDARAAQSVLEARNAPNMRKRTWPGGLSDREVEVVRLVAVGRTNREIGGLLGMSPRTAQKHVMNVYDKTGLESRAGLALYAIEHGLLDAAPRA